MGKVDAEEVHEGGKRRRTRGRKEKGDKEGKEKTRNRKRLPNAGHHLRNITTVSIKLLRNTGKQARKTILKLIFK